MISDDFSILSKTRAEEHDDDIYGKYFLPPYFSQLKLKSATKSTYIIGKRGCGKTMLLKYLDYHTAFSPNRDVIPKDEIKHIGIYWRADTQFCNSLKNRQIDENEWIIIFENYFALIVSIELVRSILAISKSKYQFFTKENFDGFEFNGVKDFHESFPTKADELIQFLESSRRKFSMWISNISTVSRPLLPPGKTFITSLIEDIQRIDGLTNAAFYVYVDEIENLVPYQRRVLNSLLKHSQIPFIVSFTSKVLSDETSTTGPESINSTHDFHLLELDKLSDENNRKRFFAEVYLANLDIAEGRKNSKLLQQVVDIASLENRRTDAHNELVMKTIRSKFPNIQYKEIAKQVIEDEKLMGILKERISKALNSRSSNMNSDEFLINLNQPEAIVVLPALLNRRRLTPENILLELIKYKTEGLGAFHSTWVQNNLVGSLLELYRPYGQTCPIYSGFDAFCTMANDNLRHFLILGYKVHEVAELKNETGDYFSIETQARASKDAAEKLIMEITTFGEHGGRLRLFVLRLGGIFRALQALPTMSEPEQNQFTINSGVRELSDKELLFLEEAKKYAILIEQLETKTKNTAGSDVVDYQLNPIYAPYFHISYRRKRKIEISVENFNAVALGSEDEYKDFLKTLLRNNKDELINEQTGLFE